MDEKWLDAIDIESCHDEGCIDCRVKAKKSLDKTLSERNISFQVMLKDKAMRNELIKKMRQDSTLSLVEIGDLFGGLSESAICKILSR
jgi:hypothetical protein